jgi:hypothetical protein
MISIGLGWFFDNNVLTISLQFLLPRNLLENPILQNLIITQPLRPQESNNNQCRIYTSNKNP